MPLSRRTGGQCPCQAKLTMWTCSRKIYNNSSAFGNIDSDKIFGPWNWPKYSLPKLSLKSFKSIFPLYPWTDGYEIWQWYRKYKPPGINGAGILTFCIGALQGGHFLLGGGISIATAGFSGSNRYLRPYIQTTFSVRHAVDENACLAPNKWRNSCGSREMIFSTRLNKDDSFLHARVFPQFLSVTARTTVAELRTEILILSFSQYNHWLCLRRGLF